MHAAQGILTARGGMTSHAAVVARGMGKCCVAGCGAININESQRTFTVNNLSHKRRRLHNPQRHNRRGYTGRSSVDNT